MDLSAPGLEALESAGFAAWPSASTSELKGWTLRLDRGYTKRANSINASGRAEALDDADVDAVQKAFADRGLPPTWRITSMAPPQEALLEPRGYRFVEPSLVMARALAPSMARAAEPTCFEGAEPWLRAFDAISGKPGAGQAAHLEILRRIAHPCAWAVTCDLEGQPLCCGLGVLVGDVVGIFDVATLATHRRRGLAFGLCSSLMAWGAKRGATTAFLQVIEANAGAAGLYRRLGFETAYTYGYHVRT